MIEVQDLTKAFSGKVVINRINLRVDEGEIFGYLGPNGAGKTTTMRILLGLMRPTSGRALVWGQNLARRDHLRQKVGVLLEYDGLYDDMSAFENLEYYARLYDVPDRLARIDRLLEFGGLTDRRNDKVGRFSRGMKRKLGLARAILNEPAVLFLDEPSAGLDPEAQKMVRDLILLLAREKTTIFLSSHDLDEVQRICSRIAILDGGQIRVCDTLENLRGGSAGVRILFHNGAEAEKGAALMAHRDYVSVIERSGDQVTAAVQGDSSTLLTFLVQNGLRVEELRRVRKSLEELYLETVQQGQAL